MKDRDQLIANHILYHIEKENDYLESALIYGDREEIDIHILALYVLHGAPFDLSDSAMRIWFRYGLATTDN